MAPESTEIALLCILTAEGWGFLWNIFDENFCPESFGILMKSREASIKTKKKKKNPVENFQMREQGSDSLSKEWRSLLKLRALLLSSLTAYFHDFLIHTIYAYVLFRGRSRAELDCIHGLRIPQVILWSNFGRWAVAIKLQLFKKRLNLILGHI